MPCAALPSAASARTAGRTGPGRGYPVFFVAARDEWVEIELRHTDWYKVRTAGGKLGWVHRSQL